MANDSKDFAAEVADLWSAGRVTFPKLANVYSQANGDISNTSSSENSAFKPFSYGGDSYTPSRVKPSWLELRNTIQGLFAQSSLNVAATGRALVQAANEYKYTDGNSASELEKVQTQTKDLPPENPPVKQPGPIEKEERPGRPTKGAY